MGVGIIFGTAVVVTIFPTNAGLAGLALTAALNLTGTFLLLLTFSSRSPGYSYALELNL